MTAIEKAVGADLSHDIRNEAVVSLYADVLDGKVAREHIASEAPRYVTRAWELLGSKFGARSLDVCNEDGWSLGDTIDDTAALEAFDNIFDYED